LRAVLTTEPDRPSADQVADHDAVGVPLANSDFVDADDRGSRCPHATELLAHVLHLQALDGLPIEAQLASHIAAGRGPTAPARVKGKAFGVEGVVGHPGQLLLFHGAATPAGYAPDLYLQVDSGVAAGKVANAAGLAVVEGPVCLPAGATDRFFRRRTSRRTRA